MDALTLAAYERAAPQYCDEWLSQPAPEDMQALWRRYFTPAAASADIGSGSGRDVDWLNRSGFPCVGYDASHALVAEARRRFPRWRFEHAALPALEGLAQGAFRNVVCETVLMHLPAADVATAAAALAALLEPGGTLYLSWRINDAAQARDGAGRLYSSFDVREVHVGLGGLEILHDAETVSASSQRRVRRVVARRQAR